MAQYTSGDKGEYVLVTSPSLHDEADCIACIDAIYDAAERFGKWKVLLDGTSTSEPLPTMALFDAGERMEKRNAKYAIRLAVVAPQAAISSDRFLQNVGRNRGVEVSFFPDDFGAAVAWLLR